MGVRSLVQGSGNLGGKTANDGYKDCYNVGYKDSTSGGGYCEWFNLHKVIGISLPPPKISRFNVPRLCLHTGLRHGPRASNLHKITIFTCGSWHRPRAPDQTVDSFWMKLALAEGATAADQTVDSFWMKLALAEGATAVDTVPD